MKTRTILPSLSVCAFLLARTLAGAALPDLKVVPWNGHKAATSLSFDDSDPSHLDTAVPELNKRKMRGTFYLIANKTDRKDDWRKALAAGHELANHTLDHRHAGDLTSKDIEAQVMGAQNVLQKEFGVQIRTFAYPFTEITPDLKAAVAKTHLLARGGYGNGAYVMKSTVEPDWWNLPARATMTNIAFDVYKGWIDEDLSGEGWMIWMIHGLEGTPWGWEPITKDNFTKILDYLASKDIWVGSVLEVGAYFRAQKVLEGCVPGDQAGERTWSWRVPDNFPDHILLKVRLSGEGKGLSLRQGKQRLPADKDGTYTVDFGKGELSLRSEP